MEKKGKAKLDMLSVPHKWKVCNHVCQTGEELSFHMMSVPLILAFPLLRLRKKTFEPIEINNIGVAVDGPFNTMGWRLPAGSSILMLLVLRPLVQQSFK